ncbi:N-6 DNA methylase [Achromobacter sp. DH1f]|uniref:N-6 DNA methylase n=1 Tax=Achromobacter sp. DH1f TaxID=1397275 RepID=UPI0009DD2844|nr:N-6 DNA methylase [Achromobacter sp. DH1f]
MAKKNNSRHTDHHRAVIKLLESFSGRHQMWRVWEDFIASVACAISASVDSARRTAREQEYQAISKRYTAEEMSHFAEGLAHVVFALEERHQDFLGSLFMALDLGNKHRGQFFTPYEVSRLMAQINFGGDVQEQVAQNGFITVLDPCIGGGAMVIAMAEIILGHDFPTHRTIHVTGVDIDITAVQMAFIQLSLLNVPAVILHGNSLGPSPYAGWNTDSAWRTPAHCVWGWEARLHEREVRRRASTAADAQDAAQTPVPPADRTAPAAASQINQAITAEVQ